MSAHLMTVAMGQASEQSFYDINYLSAVARRLEMAVGSKAGNGDGSSSGGRRKRESSDVFSTSQELKKSKHAPAAVRSVVAEAARPSGVKPKFVSRFGKTIGEHIADRTCKDCNGPFTKGHKCGTGVRGGAGGAGGKTIRVMAKGPSAKAAAKSALRAVRVNPVVNERSVGASVVSRAASFVGARVGDVSGETVAAPVESTKDDVIMSCVDGVEADLFDDHDDLKGRAEATLVDGMSNVSFADAELAMNMAAQECKFDAVFSAPPTMRSNSICVPLVVQNVVCFGFVDTGATFSCITNDFFQFLGGTSLSGFAAVNDDSVVHLAHEIATLPRLGEVSLDVSYNKTNIHHTFEVFSFYSEENVHVLLGIGITGLVSRHGFQTGPRLPDPIDDSIQPNAHPFGSDDERAPFLNSLQELLVQNSQIDMKNTACNLPDSVIKLDIVPGSVAWRAQHPLPEAYREIVAKQIKI
ncbi:hypothetical protein [Parasitella parasitica]|uniref:Uncharacterized protein n=1 Tax=Parasitella parasitica TaxID=35722 RepID=A0A0B7NM16_9FUNG|nr:hypothetical protein [Parasitella parasitica]